VGPYTLALAGRKTDLPPALTISPRRP